MGVVPNNGFGDRLIALAQSVKGVRSATSKPTSQLKLSLCCDYRGGDAGTHSAEIWHSPTETADGL
jgi:hypothetical protein